MQYKRHHAAEFSAHGYNVIAIAFYLAQPEEYAQLTKLLHTVTGLEFDKRVNLDNVSADTKRS